MDVKGRYNIVEFLSAHRKDSKYVYNVDVGKLAPNITTKVECEYLISEAFHISHTNCIRTTADNFEILVMAKHLIDRVYCCQYKVRN